MKTLLLILLATALNLPVILAAQIDSLKVSRWISDARTQMNIDANEGKLSLDSLRDYLDQYPNQPFYEGEYQKLLGIYYFRKTQLDSTLIHYQLAKDYYLQAGNELEKAKILLNTSMVYNAQGAMKDALAMVSEALGLFRKFDDKKGISVSLNIIGQIHFYNEDYENALTFFRSYLDNARLAGDSVEIASGLANIGNAFTKLEMYDSSNYYIKRALQIQLTKKSYYNIGNAMQNIATNFQELGTYDSALYYYQRAIGYYTTLHNKSGLAQTNFNIGTVLARNGNYQQAITYQQRALDLATETGELFMQKESLLNLSMNYERIGNKNKAFDLYKQYDVLSDSLLNQENKEFIAEMNAKYESEKKEQQITLQQITLNQQNAQIKLNYTIIATLGIGVALLVVIFILVRSRMKRKHEYLKRENELSLREAHINASIQSQEIERKRFAQDLHDGMGQLISSLRLLLGNINSESPIEDRVQVVAKSEKVIDEMQKEIRGIAFNLMPQTLIQHGLAPALKEMALRITSSGKVMITVNAYDLPDRLTELQEISIYRILQEWVNNILKYAQASKIEIQIVGHEDELNITIEDDGKGFEVQILKNSKGNGWRNIVSRVNLLRGEVEVDSDHNRKGTTLLVKIPLTITSGNSLMKAGIQNTQ